mmetsp:Transcript_17489/g.37792  ORF Transcript_17489/g.37792 Transcript_17489/m.37792 type:complete len:594 (+) Transcript_17489:253-2034(+)
MNRAAANKATWLQNLGSLGSKDKDKDKDRDRAAFDETKRLVDHAHGRIPSTYSGPSGTFVKPSQERFAEAHTGRPSIVQQAISEMKEFFLDTKLNLLLICVPFAIASGVAGWGDGPTFVLAMLSLIPLAERLGFVTEQLAMYTNDTLGGLLNASFGNATEVIISGFALRNNLLRVVQLSLLGSVVSNLLMVMGTAFLLGGMKHPEQRFNQTSINVNCGLLLLAVVAVLLPSLLSETETEAKGSTSELALSRFESVLMLVCYCLYLLFQLYTHRHLYEEQDSPTPAPGINRSESAKALAAAAEGNKSGGRRDLELAELPPGQPLVLGAGVLHQNSVHARSSSRELADDLEAAQQGSHSRSVSGRRAVSTSGTTSAAEAALLGRDWRNGVPGTPPEVSQAEPDAGSERASEGVVEEFPPAEEEEEEKVLSFAGCFIWLTIVTIFISLLSEYIVDAIEGASTSLKIPMPFLVTILLPIVGNAAEHASAIIFAMRNRMEIALGVAVGSSTQISVLVVPFCVILAWIMGKDLDLNFNSFEAAVLFASVLLAIVVVQDGTSNWMKGLLLLLTYFFVAAGFWCHKDTDLDNTVDAKLRLS